MRSAGRGAYGCNLALHSLKAPARSVLRDSHSSFNLPTVKRVDTTQLQSTRLEVVLQTVDERSSRLKVLFGAAPRMVVKADSGVWRCGSADH
jgi:hypothetical protein